MINRRLINTVNFKYEKYIGDPINTIRIFSEYNVDELILYDLKKKQLVDDDIKYIRKLAKYAGMPFTYGGGIKDAMEAEKLIRAGCDKISINTTFFRNRSEVKNIIDTIGRQSISISINFVKNNGILLVCDNDCREIGPTVNEALDMAAEQNVGEVVLNNIQYDGTKFYNEPYQLLQIDPSYPFSLVYLGGNNFRLSADDLMDNRGVSYATGSSYFLHGKHRAVLIRGK